MESQTWCLWIEADDNAFPAIRKPLSCCLCDYRLQRFDCGPESKVKTMKSVQKASACPLSFTWRCLSELPEYLQGPPLSLLPSPSSDATHTHILHTALGGSWFSHFVAPSIPTHHTEPDLNEILSVLSLSKHSPPFTYWFTSPFISPSHWWTLLSSSITFSTEPSLV